MQTLVSYLGSIHVFLSLVCELKEPWKGSLLESFLTHQQLATLWAGVHPTIWFWGVKVRHILKLPNRKNKPLESWECDFHSLPRSVINVERSKSTVTPTPSSFPCRWAERQSHLQAHSAPPATARVAVGITTCLGPSLLPLSDHTHPMEN